MADAIRYCDRCHQQILPTEVRDGDAIVRDKVAFCEMCAKSLSNDSLRAIQTYETTTRNPKVTKKRPSSSRDRRRRSSAGKTPLPKRGSRISGTGPHRKSSHAGMRAVHESRRAKSSTAMLGAIGGASLGLLTIAVLLATSGSDDPQQRRPGPSSRGSPATRPRPVPAPPTALWGDAPEPTTAAARQLAAIEARIAPGLPDYADIVKELRAFPVLFAGTPEAGASEALLRRVQRTYRENAQNDTRDVFEAARKEARAKRFDEAIALLTLAAKNYEGTEWYADEGKRLYDNEIANMRNEKRGASRHVAPPPSTPDLMRGLVGWWRLDAITDGKVADSSPGNHDGTVVGRTKSSADKKRSSIELDGTDSGFTVPYHVDLDLHKEISIALWLRPDTVTHPSNLKRLIVAKRGNARLPSPYDLLMTPSGNLEFSYTDVDGPPMARFVFGRLRELKWTHVAVTRDDSGNIVGYINGSKVEVAKRNRVESPPRGYSRPLYVGFSKDDLSKHEIGSCDDFMGRISDVRIYDRVLMPEEVGQLHRSQ
jgi:hypothetical protein